MTRDNASTTRDIQETFANLWRCQAQEGWHPRGKNGRYHMILIDFGRRFGRLLLCLLIHDSRFLSPNPPKDTDGGREDSGRGWVRELQGRWPGVGLDGRPADGLQSPHRDPKALCGSCDARDGERDTQQGTLAAGVARDCGDVESVAGWPSGRERNGLQPGQGATELGFPRPAPGEMQSEAARRAGDPSHQSEDPPPEGLGDHGPLARPIRAVQRARLCAITWTASQAPLAAKRADGMWFSPTPYLRSRMAFSTSAWRR